MAAIKASRADRTDYRRTRAPQFAQKEAAGVNGAPQLRQASPTDANGGPPVGADASRAGAIGGGLGYMPAYGGKAGDIGALRPRPLSATTKITPTMSRGTPMQRKGTKTTPTIVKTTPSKRTMPLVETSANRSLRPRVASAIRR